MSIAEFLPENTYVSSLRYRGLDFSFYKLFVSDPSIRYKVCVYDYSSDTLVYVFFESDISDILKYVVSVADRYDSFLMSTSPKSSH